MTVDIHKAGAILLKDRKLLIAREKGETHFKAPGGSLKGAESPKDSLIRELEEEFQLKVSPSDLEIFGTFYAKAAGEEKKKIQMDVFLVKNWTTPPVPGNEIEELFWVNSQTSDSVEIGSIFKHDVLPRLKALDLID